MRPVDQNACQSMLLAVRVDCLCVLFVSAVCGCGICVVLRLFDVTLEIFSPSRPECSKSSRCVFLVARSMHSVHNVVAEYLSVTRYVRFSHAAKLNDFRSFPIQFRTAWSSGCRLSGSELCEGRGSCPGTQMELLEMQGECLWTSYAFLVLGHFASDRICTTWSWCFLSNIEHDYGG